MILRAGFDLGTFSILFDRTYAQEILDETAIDTAIAAGRYSNPIALGYIDRLESETERETFVEVASAIWHEKRHFFDTVLTNYGALRARQYFHVIGYASALIDVLRANGAPLVAPIEIYADRVRRRLFSVENVPQEIEALARAVAKRQQLFDTDSMGWQGIQLGGEAQFEAMAFYSQLAAIQSGFGLPALQAFQNRLSIHDQWKPRYRWVEHMAARFGIELFSEPGPHNMRGIDIPLVSPLLTASLMVRAHNQEPVSKGELEKLPAGRLARLCEVLAEHKIPPPGKRDVIEMWCLVNRAAEKLWGRTAEKELVADFEHEAEFIAQLEEAGAFARDAYLIYNDVHRLRGELIAILKRDPRTALDLIPWSGDILPRLDPLLIELFPAGRQAVHPSHSATSASPTFFWAGTYPRKVRYPGQLSLGHDEIWKRVHAGASPLAKLFLSGRRDQGMIGPEHEKIEQQLASMGLPVQVDVHFAWPETHPTSAVFQLTHRDAHRCRACGSCVWDGSGRLVSAWTIKKHPSADRLPGARPPASDWTPWLLCDSCARILV